MKKPPHNIEYIKSQLRKKWVSGAILRGEVEYPFKIAVSASSVTGANTLAITEWKKELLSRDGCGYRVVLEEVNSRTYGRNTLPVAVLIDNELDAVKLLSCRADFEAYKEIVSDSETIELGVDAWVRLHPFKSIAHHKHWFKIVKTVRWLLNNIEPSIYLRQAAIPGVHTKFIYQHKVDIESIFCHVAGHVKLKESKHFEERFGFLMDSPSIRMRILDPKLKPLGVTDLTLPSSELETLRMPVKRVFITENLVNCLAFPDVPDSIILFGKGYGFAHWEKINWMRDCDVFYWGDIDTHGFSILNQFRATFPNAKSLLMDMGTFLSNTDSVVDEPKQSVARLDRLTQDERKMYYSLLPDGECQHKRLEQELIPYTDLIKALQNLNAHPHF